MEQNNTPWHSKTIEQVFEALNSQPSGLSQSEVEERAAKYGPNEIQAAQRISA